MEIFVDIILLACIDIEGDEDSSLKQVWKYFGKTPRIFSKRIAFILLPAIYLC